MSLSVADFAAGSIDLQSADHPDWGDLFELRRFLRLGVADLVADRNPEEPPLRITKGRLRSTAICPAQLLGELSPFSINFHLGVGIVCDAAAGILAIHPGFQPPGSWFEALHESLSQEHPHVVEYVGELGPRDRLEFDDTVNELCGSLPTLLGPLGHHRPTVHHRIAYVTVPGVHLTGEIDIAVDHADGGRILCEVKSGVYNPRISDELAHYALIVGLQQLPPDEDAASLVGSARAVIGCSVSLADLAVTPVPLSLDILETAARRVLETTKSLVSIDEAMERGQLPPTNPGDHCRWCKRVFDCADAPDLILAELNETAPHRIRATSGPDDDAADYEDNEFDDA